MENLAVLFGILFGLVAGGVYAFCHRWRLLTLLVVLSGGMTVLLSQYPGLTTEEQILFFSPCFLWSTIGCFISWVLQSFSWGLGRYLAFRRTNR